LALVAGPDVPDERVDQAQLVCGTKVEGTGGDHSNCRS